MVGKGMGLACALFMEIYYLLLEISTYFSGWLTSGFLQQPEFYEYLKEVDKELLEFDDEGIDVSILSDGWFLWYFLITFLHFIRFSVNFLPNCQSFLAIYFMC